MDAYKGKTSRQKYAKSDNYLKFKQAIYVGVVLPDYVPTLITSCLAGGAPSGHCNAAAHRSYSSRYAYACETHMA